MSHLRILIADDEPEHRQLLELAITARCPEAVITAVESSREVIAAIEKEPFDCVVLDFNLAGTRADELLTEMADRELHSPVVIISSAREQDVVVRSLRSGVADFVPKSEAFDGPALWDRIQVAIGRHQRQTPRTTIDQPPRQAAGQAGRNRPLDRHRQPARPASRVQRPTRPIGPARAGLLHHGGC